MAYERGQNLHLLVLSYHEGEDGQRFLTVPFHPDIWIHETREVDLARLGIVGEQGVDRVLYEDMMRQSSACKP
jgi:hypothetical protein